MSAPIEKAVSLRSRNASSPRSGKAPSPPSKKETEGSGEQEVEELGMPRPSVLPPEVFDKLVAELDAPAKPSPGLVALIKETEGFVVDSDLDD